MIHDLLARDVAATFSTPDWIGLEALEPDKEWQAEIATQWLRYQAHDRFNLQHNIIPTYQGVHVFGTSYRHVGSAWDKRDIVESVPGASFMGIPVEWGQVRRTEEQWRLTDQALDFFSVYPLPNGGCVNPQDNAQETAVDGVGVVDWMPEDKIKALADAGIFDKDEVGKMVDSQPREDAFEDEFKQYMRQARVENTGYPGWLNRMTHSKYQTRRRRVMRWYFRDEWNFVADNRYLLYHGPGLPNGVIPVAKYTDKQDFENWFGIGTMECIYDLLISRMLLFNLRCDYLAQLIHPTRLVSQRLMQSNPNLGDFGPEPFKEIIVPSNLEPSKAIHYDRFPDITQQAFTEEGFMDKYYQEVSGHTDMAKGGTAPNALAYGTASGIVSSVEQGNSRNTLRALNLEGGGLRDELWLMLLQGSIYMNHEEAIRIQTAEGYPWAEIDPQAISERYGIRLKGTKDLASKQVLLAQLLQLYPLFANDPYVRDPVSLRKQVLDKFGIFEHTADLIGESPQPMGMGMPGAAGGGEGGGEPGPMNAQNMGRSMMGRNRVTEPGMQMAGVA